MLQYTSGNSCSSCIILLLTLHVTQHQAAHNNVFEVSFKKIHMKCNVTMSCIRSYAPGLG